MKINTYIVLMAVVTLIACAVPASAKEKKDDDRQKGYLTGSFETSTNMYHNDEKTSATVPDGHFGSNNYLKLDYYSNRFSVGVQMTEEC